MDRGAWRAIVHGIQHKTERDSFVEKPLKTDLGYLGYYCEIPGIFTEAW